jgi:hypothetical protein
MFTLSRFLPESYIHQQDDNRQKRIHNSYIVGNFSKINHFLESSFSFLARIRNRIPSNNLYVNRIKSSSVLNGITNGSINNNINKPAERLINRSDIISSHTGESLLKNFIFAY